MEDNGEAIFPWLLGGVCVLGLALLALVAAMFRFRLPDDAAAGADGAKDLSGRRGGPAAGGDEKTLADKKQAGKEETKK